MAGSLAPLLSLPMANVLAVAGIVPPLASVAVYGLCGIVLLNFYIRLREPLFLYTVSILLSIQLLSLYLFTWLGLGVVPDLILLYVVLVLTVLTKDSTWGYIYGVETPVIIVLAVALGVGLGLGSPMRYAMFSLLESLGVASSVPKWKASIPYYVFFFLILYSTPYILREVVYAGFSALIFMLKLLTWWICRGGLRYLASADVVAKVGLAVVLNGP